MTLKNKTLSIRPTTQYKRDLKKAIKQRKNLTLLFNGTKNMLRQCKSVARKNFIKINTE